jgi:hypothetical protein
MQDTKSCIGSQYQGTTRAMARRAPMTDARGMSVSPHLVVIAASLALWAMIIAACSVVIG